MYKYLIALALTIFAATASAQIGQQSLGTPYNEVWVRNFIYSDSGMRAFTPLSDTAFGLYVSASHKNGTTALVGGVPYVYYGHWIKIATGTPGTGSVTNVATGLGLSGGPITTTGTIVVDTASAVILSRQRADNTYLKIADTSTAFGPYARKDGSNATGTWPIGITGNAGTATKWATARTIAITGDMTYNSGSLDGSANVTAAGTLATVNSGGGTVGSSTAIPSITYNAKGLVTASSTNAVIAPAGTLTGATLASNVLASSLTSVGTLSALTVTAPISGSVTGNAGTVTTNANLTGPITSVGNATSIASQTGTGTKFVVDNTPTLITPVLGVATATSINTGTTLNGVIFGKSTTDISLASTAHAATFGGEANSTNLALGEYSTGVGLQARNNGAVAALYQQPLGGDIQVGSTLTGVQNFIINNTDAGTGSYIEMGLRNGAASADALLFRTLGTGFTTSGMNFQDGGFIGTGTNLAGGLSIGTQASADLRLYTNNTLRWTMAAATGNITTTGQFVSSGGGLGYTTGAGGTAVQGTSRTTTVVLNKLCGTFTMFSAAQAANALVTFTLTNSFIAATDFVLVQHISATNGGAWNISVVAGAGSATINIRNVSTASITEATPLRITVIKATTN